MARNNLLKSHDLFVFDWDGTLSSMRLTLRLNEWAKRQLGIWNKDSNIKDISPSNFDLKRQLHREEVKIDILTRIFDVFLNFSRPRLHNDSIQLIEELHKKGKKVALFSNGRSQRVIKELEYLGITDYFDMIISARDINALKPNPSGLKAILKSFKEKPEKCVYIGDMVDDIITAKLIGVHSCAIAAGFDSYHTLKSVHPDYIFRSLEQMKSSL